jgi:single-strand DNA-binding protein
VYKYFLKEIGGIMNKVVLMGRLTREPDLRYTAANNIPVSDFTLAVDRRFSRTGEERQADFIKVVAWNKTAEFCSKYFHKGQQVSVVGRIQVRTWDDSEGKRRYITEVVAEEAYFAGNKKDNGTGSYTTAVEAVREEKKHL